MRELSKRLYAIASLVDRGAIVADIGTDHGYLPIYLLEQGICQKAIAMDIRLGPLERARTHIKEHNLSEYIETRLSNGMKELRENEADTVVLAGMGGRLMLDILEAKKENPLLFYAYIMQPQSEVPLVRKCLQDKGYEIRAEKMVEEGGKYYPIIKARKGQMNWEREIDFQYGKFLLEEKDPVLYTYLQKQREKVREIERKIKKRGQGSEEIHRRLLTLWEEKNRIKEALESYE
ncbi:SAM-dependent methyltransferase [bacterium 1XD42-8]|jgi:tRNA (adenine22-N1)-methyltransferase|nr:SAM-dependent methyltransferase [bacterium 1XD42-8]